MKESEWLACSEPGPMLVFLGNRVGDRKLRLFACACCRRAWGRLTDPRSRQAVETAERYADGRATGQDLAAARNGALSAAARRAAPEAWAVYWATSRGIAQTFVKAAGDIAQSGARFAALTARERGGSEYAAWTSGETAELYEQARLLRDVLGNPFRPVRLDPAWLAWNDGTIPKMAGVLYEERAFDRLPLLADALEDAGCDDADIMGHCRGPGPHVRGCWVVDLLIGKA